MAWVWGSGAFGNCSKFTPNVTSLTQSCADLFQNNSGCLKDQASSATLVWGIPAPRGEKMATSSTQPLAIADMIDKLAIEAVQGEWSYENASDLVRAVNAYRKAHPELRVKAIRAVAKAERQAAHR